MLKTLEPIESTIDSGLSAPVSEAVASSAGSESSRIKSLDGLRVFAFLSVFLHHLGAIPEHSRGPAAFYNVVVTWGYLGVDLFFVISGFIITALLLDEKTRNQRISIKRFFQRRALRIWPLFYLMLVISVVGNILFAKSSFDLQLYWQILEKAYAPLFFFVYMLPLPVAEMIAKLMQQTNFPTIQSIAPMWSLCVEEQFYLIWPWCVAFAKTRRQLVFAVLTAVVLTELCRFMGQPEIPGFFYLNPVAKVTPLAVGVLIAIGSRSNLSIFKSAARRSGLLLVLFATISCCIFAGFSHNEGTHHLVEEFPQYPLIALALGCLLLAVLNNPVVKRLFAAEHFQRFGKYTYCMYLVHLPILYVVRTSNWNWLHDNVLRHALIGLVSLGLTFAVAKLSWSYIEQPLALIRARFKN